MSSEGGGPLVAASVDLLEEHLTPWASEVFLRGVGTATGDAILAAREHCTLHVLALAPRCPLGLTQRCGPMGITLVSRVVSF